MRYVIGHRFDGQRAVEAMDPRIPVGKLEEPMPHALVEVDRLGLDAVAAPALAAEDNGHRGIDQERDIRLSPARRVVVQPPDEIEIESSPVPLVGKARQAIAARHDSLSGLERREENLPDVLGAARHEEQKLGQRRQGLAVVGRKQYAPNAHPNFGPTRFAGQENIATGSSQSVPEQLHLGRLPREVEALKDNQLSGEVDGRPPPTRA